MPNGMLSDGMYHRSGSAMIAEDLEKFLDCGSKMTHVDTVFFLGERSWSIQVPVCALCEPDIENLPLM